jgi:hypothetical protein
MSQTMMAARAARAARAAVLVVGTVLATVTAYKADGTSRTIYQPNPGLKDRLKQPGNDPYLLG